MLHQALSLCSSLVDEDSRFEAAFFESVRVLVLRLTNTGVGKKISLPEMNARINELLKQSIKSDGVINLFSDIKEEFCFIYTPYISYTKILPFIKWNSLLHQFFIIPIQNKTSLFDPKFLQEVANMKEKNLAVELLKKLIAEQVSVYRRTNVVKSEKFSEIMQRSLNAYLNGMLTNEEVIEEMLKLAKQIAAAQKEGDKLGLTADELNHLLLCNCVIGRNESVFIFCGSFIRVGNGFIKQIPQIIYIVFSTVSLICEEPRT